MAPHQDDLTIGLQEAIKTTLVQLCKVGIIYQYELAIAGTVGVTVDKKRTILVHFDERLDPCQPDTSTVYAAAPQFTEASADVINNGAVTGQASTSSNQAALGLLPLTSSPPETSSSTLTVSYNDLAAQFTNTSTPCTKNEAYVQTLPASIPVSIDIESDSDSLCELGFDDDVIEVDPASMIRKKEVMWSGEDGFDVKKDDKEEIKCADLDSNMEMEASAQSTVDESEPSSSAAALVADDGNAQCMMNPPRLLIDKRLFLKKMSPEKTRATTRLSAAREAQAREAQAREAQAREAAVMEAQSAALAASVSTAGGSMVTAQQPTSTAEPMSVPDNPVDNNTALTTKSTTATKPPLICEVCGKGYLTHGLLEAHLVEAHGVVFSAFIGKIVHFTCKHCNKKFRYQATLDKHEFLHVADKPFKCQICNNTYCYEESLQIHMNVHSGILDCLICQKMYSSRKHLQKHIVYMHEMRRVRSGITPKKRLLSLEEQDDAT